MLKRWWKDLLSDFEKFLVKPRSRSSIIKLIYIFFIATLLLSSYLLYGTRAGKVFQYQTGDIAEEDIIVKKDIRYELKDETDKLRSHAYETTELLFNRNYDIYRKVVRDLTAELNDILNLKGENKYEMAQERHPFLRRSDLITRDDFMQIYSDTNRYTTVPWAIEFATLVFDNYAIIDKPFTPPNTPELHQFLVKTIPSTNETQTELRWEWDKLIYSKDIFKYQNYSRLSKLGSQNTNKRVSSGVKKLIILRVLQHYYANPYLFYNETETLKRKEQAAAAIKPVYSILKKGLIIARAGDPIDSFKLNQINTLNLSQEKSGTTNILGGFLIQFLILFGISYYIYKFSEFSMRDVASYIILISILYMILLTSFGLSNGLVFQGDHIYFALLVPVGFLSTSISLLLGARVAFATGIYVSLFLFQLSNNEFATFVISLMWTVIGIYTTANMEKRTQLFGVAFLSGLVISVTVVGLDLNLDLFGVGTGQRIMAAFLNAFLSIVLATGFLPLYESIFNLPTRFRLMELSDMNHPLLKQLSTEAPSSYAHSLMMASLSEKAVSAIGGDTLLTRVGCLYHDIGKMNNAAIYAENKDLEIYAGVDVGLSTEEYARTIIKHVTDGITMARQFRLPEKIVSFIPEHHGTSVIHYFYHKALKEAKKNKPVDKRMFQYPGPKPRSKETAVVMMADSIEAASRSLTGQGKEKFEELIDQIVDAKMNDRQFDDSTLTLTDIKKIKESFLEVLISTIHLRPKSPTRSSTENLEKKQSSQSTATAATEKGKNSSEKTTPSRKKNQKLETRQEKAS